VDAGGRAGSELNEHPYDPITPRRAARASPSSATTCRSRGCTASERYGEKLATPDTSIADLIGEVDPIKVAEGRYLSDELRPALRPGPPHQPRHLRHQRAARPRRAHPGRPAQRARGARHPDPRLKAAPAARRAAVVASANPEDYTNRGRIITPLKDRFGAEIRTHYPLELDDEIAVIARRRSGVARVVDLETAVDVLGGKIEFESGEEGREAEVLAHLLRTATAETVREHLRGIDLGPLVAALDGRTVTTGEQVTAREFLDGLPRC
jgi:magnesium chelatase subunit I